MKRAWLAALGLMCVGAGLAVWAAGCGSEKMQGSAETVKNLQAAYNGESNAKARYEASALKADEEGYQQVASLFRAAATAEGIHLANHAKVIRAMGAEPTAEIEAPEVGTTSENLAAGIKGETYERLTMYPDYIKQARADGSDSAVQTFSYALAAETEHAKLYKMALDDLGNWKTGPKTFIVCDVCGFTTLNLDLSKCPVCSNPKEGLKEVA